MVVRLGGCYPAIHDLHVLAALYNRLRIDLYVLEPIILDVYERVDYLSHEGEQLLLTEVLLIPQPTRDEVSERALRLLHKYVDLIIVGAELLLLYFAERVEV